MEPQTLWTIGHSNRPQSSFIDLLRGEAIVLLADVRRFPGSRRHPQFGGEALERALREDGIEYRHFPALGGRRSKRAAASPNNAWRVAAFNAYADYMLSTEFLDAFEQLVGLAVQKRTAVMCAEALPWQCHRRLISDQFAARGWRVLDIMGANQVKEHHVPAFAQMANGVVTYPAKTLFD